MPRAILLAQHAVPAGVDRQPSFCGGLRNCKSCRLRIDPPATWPRASTQSIADTYAVLVATYSPDDVEDLVGTVKAHITADQGGDEIYQLIASNGAELAGNAKPKASDYWPSTVAARALRPLRRAKRYRVFVGTFDGFRLLVGMSEADMSEVNEIALTSFASAAAVVARPCDRFGCPSWQLGRPAPVTDHRGDYEPTSRGESSTTRIPSHGQRRRHRCAWPCRSMPHSNVSPTSSRACAR